MNTFVAIDLGQLPAPQIVEQIDYEQILAERKAYAVTRHLTGLDIILETRLDAFVGFAVYDGDEIEVYPWNNPDIDVPIRGYSGVSLYTLDELDVYPHG